MADAGARESTKKRTVLVSEASSDGIGENSERKCSSHSERQEGPNTREEEKEERVF